MKQILVIGLGRFGRHLCQKLGELGHQIMAVDKDEERVEACMHVVTNALVGDATRQDFLQSLGVDNYDLCIVCIGDSFQDSLETTALLKDFGAKKVIARASRDVHARFLLRNGADEVVYPEKQVAEWTAMRYSSDFLTDYFSMGDGYAVVEVKAPGSWVGKTIAELDLRKRAGINILAAKSGGRIEMAIRPDTVITGEERLLVLGRDAQITRLLEKG
ncbi:MAG: TrkA family potassium uptake protein [Lachnospiraceae bacterium]|nr:TrkA family potassium uptake protein [Lachnospiraceae bacterium]